MRTAYNKFIDLLAVDEEVNLHILELKRDRTPREVLRQESRLEPLAQHFELAEHEA